MNEKYKEELKEGFAKLIEALVADLVNKEKFSKDAKTLISKGSYYGSLLLMNQVEKEYKRFQEMNAKLSTPIRVPQDRLTQILFTSPDIDSAIDTISHELVSGRLRLDSSY